MKEWFTKYFILLVLSHISLSKDKASTSRYTCMVYEGCLLYLIGIRLTINFIYCDIVAKQGIIILSTINTALHVF